MKKIYAAPLTKVVKINIEQMICNSPLNTVTGLTGVSRGSGDFTGGDVDSKDDFEDFDESLW